MSKSSILLKALFATMIFVACKETVDTSKRYVFKYDTIMSYLEKHEQYSQYLALLEKMPVSSVSETTLAQLLTARGNYTVFAPTDSAIQLYLDTLWRKGILTEPTWDGFPTERARDSIEQVIV